MIENDKWGGTCPNYGCDPTKMMMAVIEAKSHVEHLKGQGISGDLKIDWKGLRSRKLNITDPYEKSTFEGLKMLILKRYMVAQVLLSKENCKLQERFIRPKLILLRQEVVHVV